MKRNIILLSIFILLLGCSEKKYFREVVSKEMVSISKATIINDEFLVMNIPLEFNLFLDKSNEQDVGFYFEIDNKTILHGEDYLIFDKKTKKWVWSLKNREYVDYPKSIYIFYLYKVNDEYAQELIKKYNPKKSLDDLKTYKDTIHLVSYAKFRKDNPKFLKEMRKKTDSLQLSIGFKGGKQMVVGEKIKW